MEGKCSVCHVLGPPGRAANFLCEWCVHPLEVRVLCVRCGHRKRLNAAEGVFYLAEMLMHSPPELGTAVRLEGCIECTPNSTDRKTGVAYAMRCMRGRTIPVLEHLAAAQRHNIAPRMPGHCIICQRPSGGLAERRGCCTFCASPQQTRTYCSNCGARERHDPAQGITLPGMVTCTEYCTICDPPRTPGAIRIVELDGAIPFAAAIRQSHAS
ncbi:hypothetical protein HYV74_03340 [Candidatus Uhrbacteria bacterium]|nr:hypothetical protein [Candidatus Uhrbacteria bacterium]